MFSDYWMASLLMHKKSAFAVWARLFGTVVVPSAVVILVTACASPPITYRLEAQIVDFIGPHHYGATATRVASHWEIERKNLKGQTSRISLSRQDSLALDAALADPALYARPQPLSAEGCLDAPLIILDVIPGDTRRRMTLQCATSPAFEAVLGILLN